MPSIISGSLMRATPPSVRMSAGTRSSAMTAQAPASSAILACSGVTTSMMTPPFNISARPRLTGNEPVIGLSLMPARLSTPGARRPGGIDTRRTAGRASPGVGTIRDMATLVLTVIGDDRAGLVNAVAEVVARHGGNWEQSQMAELAGKFAGIVLVTVPDASADGLVAALEPLQGMLDITAQVGAATDVPMPVLAAVRARPRRRRPSRHRPRDHRGARRPRCQHRRLRTEARDAPMSGGRLFEAHAVLEVSPTTDLGALRVALERLADELMVDIELDAPPDRP